MLANVDKDKSNWSELSFLFWQKDLLSRYGDSHDKLGWLWDSDRDRYIAKSASLYCDNPWWVLIIQQVVI